MKNEKHSYVAPTAEIAILSQEDVVMISVHNDEQDLDAKAVQWSDILGQ